MTVSSYLNDPYPERDGTNRWAKGIWERRGWLQDLKFLTKLERLEIPWVVILGYTPPCPNHQPCGDKNVPERKLRDVLPDRIKELHLRHDLQNAPTSFTYCWDTGAYRFFNGSSTPQFCLLWLVGDILKDYFMHGHGKYLQILTTTFEVSDTGTSDLWDNTLRYAGVEGQMDFRVCSPESDEEYRELGRMVLSHALSLRNGKRFMSIIKEAQ